jgi:hypothetical protein
MDANVVTRLDQDIQLGKMLINAFQRYDELRQNIDANNGIIHGRGLGGGEKEDGENNATNFDFEAMDMEQEVDYETIMSNMLKDVQTPLYEGCPISHLATILLLLNLCNTHGINNMFVDKFFSLLKLDLFPKDSILPKSLYEVKTIVKWLGFNYNSILACYNDYVLFKGELKDSKACPKCKRSRYIEGSNIVPCKVLHHFPLIPRFK